jgi:hypothetical protein
MRESGIGAAIIPEGQSVANERKTKQSQKSLMQFAQVYGITNISAIPSLTQNSPYKMRLSLPKKQIK